MADEGNDTTRDYVAGTAVGRGSNLDAAVKDGYDKLKGRNGRPPFRIVEIWADGTNPFTGYSVIMRDDS